MKKISYAILIAIFLLTLGTRLYFSFSTQNYSSEQAYFTIRQIETIQQTGKPLYSDPLSFSGRALIFPPLFGYILAFLGLIFPITFTAKFFPNLFASLLVFVVYLIAKKLSRNRLIALSTAFIVSFVPIFFNQTLNNISVYSLVIPLFFLLLYSFMNLKSQKWVYCYVIVIIILTLIHPSVILFVIGLWFYLLLLKIEGIEPGKAELEIIIFSSFFVLLVQFIMFKKIFLFHGPLVIWQNIPKELLSKYFLQFSIFNVLYWIGIIPTFCGVYITYKYIFRQKKKEVYLLIGFIFSVALLLWLRLIQLKAGFIFLGIIMALLFAQFWKIFSSYIKTTKLAGFKWAFSLLAFALVALTLILPSFSLANETIQTSITEVELDALEWIRQNTPENSVVLATVDEGSLITTVAKRKNIIDSNFLMIKDAEQRYKDAERIYKTFSVTDAIALLNKYKINYIYFSPKAAGEYRIDGISYAESRCFPLVYDKEIKIYESVCRMEEIR